MNKSFKNGCTSGKSTVLMSRGEDVSGRLPLSTVTKTTGEKTFKR